jgi:hypothetical protein
VSLARVLAYFDEMVDIAFNGSHGGFVCVLMRGYFDESGTHDTSRVTTLAGYIGTANDWRLLLPEWQEVLAIDGDGMELFHANDFEHYARAHRWDENKRADFLGKLAEVINRHTWHGFGGSVVTADYNKLPSSVRKRIHSRYHFCFHVMMHLLRVQLESIVASESLALAFEQKDKVIGRILDDFDDILAEDYQDQLGPVIIGTKKKMPLLQVADFLVYETNLGLDSVLHQGKPIRPALEHLMQHRQMHYGYHDWSTLRHLPTFLEMDRDELLAGRSALDAWWPASWHTNYKTKKKRKYISGHLTAR